LAKLFYGAKSCFSALIRPYCASGGLIQKNKKNLKNSQYFC